MQEKTEWELVDDGGSPSGSASPRHAQSDAPGQAQGAPSITQVLRALMGPWWGWKVFGAALFASLVVAMLIVLTGVFAVVAAAGAVVAVGVAKLRQWLRRHNGALAR